MITNNLIMEMNGLIFFSVLFVTTVRPQVMRLELVDTPDEQMNDRVLESTEATLKNIGQPQINDRVLESTDTSFKGIGHHQMNDRVLESTDTTFKVVGHHQINDRVLESTDTTFKGIGHRQMNDRVLESTDTTFKGIGHRQMNDRVLESTDTTFKGIGHRQMNDRVLESTDTTFKGIGHRQMNDRVLESTDTTFKGIGHRQMNDRVLESTDTTFKGIGHRQMNGRVLESTDTTFKGMGHRQMNGRVLESTDTTFKGIGHRQMNDRVLESTDTTFKGIGHRQMNDGVLESTATTFKGIGHRQNTEDGLSHITACSRHGLEVLLSARNNLISCSIRKRRDRCRRRFGADAVCRGERDSDSGICCIGVNVERRRDKVSAQDRYMGGMSGQTPSGRPVVRKKVVHTGTSGGGGYHGSSGGTVVRKSVVHTDTSGGSGYQGSLGGTVVRKSVVRTGSSGGDYHDSAGGPVMRKSIVHTESVPVVKKTVHKSVTRTETVVTGIGGSDPCTERTCRSNSECPHLYLCHTPMTVGAGSSGYCCRGRMVNGILVLDTISGGSGSLLDSGVSGGSRRTVSTSWSSGMQGGGERCTNRPCRVPADCRKDDFCDVSMPVGSTLAQQGYRGYCCRRQISGGIAGGSHGVVGGGSLVLDTVSGGSGLMDTGVVRGSSRKTVTSWDSGTQRSGKVCHDGIRSFDYCGTSANCPRAKVCDPVLGVCCRELIADGIVSKGAGTLVVDTTSGRHSVLDTGLTGGSTRSESSWSSHRRGSLTGEICADGSPSQGPCSTTEACPPAYICDTKLDIGPSARFGFSGFCCSGTVSDGLLGTGGMVVDKFSGGSSRRLDSGVIGGTSSITTGWASGGQVSHGCAKGIATDMYCNSRSECPQAGLHYMCEPLSSAAAVSGKSGVCCRLGGAGPIHGGTGSGTIVTGGAIYKDTIHGGKAGIGDGSVYREGSVYRGGKAGVGGGSVYREGSVYRRGSVYTDGVGTGTIRRDGMTGYSDGVSSGIVSGTVLSDGTVITDGTSSGTVIKGGTVVRKGTVITDGSGTGTVVRRGGGSTTTVITDGGPGSTTIIRSGGGSSTVIQDHGTGTSVGGAPGHGHIITDRTGSETVVGAVPGHGHVIRDGTGTATIVGEPGHGHVVRDRTGVATVVGGQGAGTVVRGGVRTGTVVRDGTTVIKTGTVVVGGVTGTQYSDACGGYEIARDTQGVIRCSVVNKECLGRVAGRSLYCHLITESDGVCCDHSRRIPGWTGPVSGGPISGGTGSIPSSGYLVTVCTKRDEFPQFTGRELSRCSRYDTTCGTYSECRRAYGSYQGACCFPSHTPGGREVRCTNGREVSGFCDSHQECQFLGPQFRCQRNPSARVISGKQGGCCDNRIQGPGHYGGSSTGGGVADSYAGRSGPYVGPARGTKRVFGHGRSED